MEAQTPTPETASSAAHALGLALAAELQRNDARMAEHTPPAPKRRPRPTWPTWRRHH